MPFQCAWMGVTLLKVRRLRHKIGRSISQIAQSDTLLNEQTRKLGLNLNSDQNVQKQNAWMGVTLFKIRRLRHKFACSISQIAQSDTLLNDQTRKILNAKTLED